MSCNSFNAERHGDWWIKKLTDEQKEYYETHMNKDIFKRYSPEMKIDGNSTS